MLPQQSFMLDQAKPECIGSRRNDIFHASNHGPDEEARLPSSISIRDVK